MGTIRFLLAVSVVLAHGWPTAELLVGGVLAVQLFYLISGFLISYILTATSNYKRTRNFYLNRFLRIYPTYAVVALLTLPLFLSSPQLSGFLSLPPGAQAMLVAVNALLFGQDWVMFAGVEGDSLAFSSDFQTSDPILATFLLVPQAWTLGLELTFYVLAPFILRRPRVIWTLLGLSIAARMWAISVGFGLKDPWTYRFFPFELSLFLLGAIAQQYLQPLLKRGTDQTQEVISVAAVTSFIMVLVGYYLLPSPYLRHLFVCAVAFLSLPLWFTFQSNHPWDVWLGGLSYPIYVGHLLVDRVFSHLWPLTGHAPTMAVRAASALAGAICFSVALRYLVEKPIENLRSNIRGKFSKERLESRRSKKRLHSFPGGLGVLGTRPTPSTGTSSLSRPRDNDILPLG